MGKHLRGYPLFTPRKYFVSTLLAEERIEGPQLLAGHCSDSLNGLGFRCLCVIARSDIAWQPRFRRAIGPPDDAVIERDVRSAAAFAYAESHRGLLSHVEGGGVTLRGDEDQVRAWIDRGCERSLEPYCCMAGYELRLAGVFERSYAPLSQIGDDGFTARRDVCRLWRGARREIARDGQVAVVVELQGAWRNDPCRMRPQASKIGPRPWLTAKSAG
jgi:hypothetical protein